MIVDLLEPKKQFVPRPPESPEVIEARWKKKKESIKNLSDNIRKLKVNVSRDINDENEKESLTALVVSVMLQTAERIGNDKSAGDGHLGVTGFTKENVSVSGNSVSLNYTGKSGVKHEKCFSDERVAKALKDAIKNSSSSYVFETSNGFRIKPDRVSRYLKPYGMKPKDIRGYLANKFALEKLNKIEPEENDKKRKKQLNKILKDVAERVGHGRPTLRKHYLIPELWDEWVNNGKVIDISDLGYMEKGGEAVGGYLFGGETSKNKEKGFIAEDNKFRFEINDKDCRIIANVDDILSGKIKSLPLTHYITHKKLFNHYPEFRNINVVFKSIDEFKKHYPEIPENRIPDVVASFDYTDRNKPDTYQIIYYIDYASAKKSSRQTYDFLFEGGIGELQHAIQTKSLFEEERGLAFYIEVVRTSIREGADKIKDLPKNDPNRMAGESQLAYLRDNLFDFSEELYLNQYPERESREAVRRIKFTDSERKSNIPSIKRKMGKGGEVDVAVEDDVDINASFNKVDCPYQIFEITSNSKSAVAKIVVRFQEYYDEKEFKGKIFTLDEFKEYYSKGGKFTYYYDWNGFNFPDYAVKSFLDGKFDPLSPEEKWLIDNIKAKVDLTKPYYIIGYSNDDEPTINHERAHALYYMSPEYKKSADAIIDSIPKSELGTLTKFMDVRNYHPSVYKDEMQAYLMADKEYLMKYNGWQDSYELDHQELRIIFDRYFRTTDHQFNAGGVAVKSNTTFSEYYAENGWLIF